MVCTRPNNRAKSGVFVSFNYSRLACCVVCCVPGLLTRPDGPRPRPNRSLQLSCGLQWGHCLTFDRYSYKVVAKLSSKMCNDDNDNYDNM